MCRANGYTIYVSMIHASELADTPKKATKATKAPSAKPRIAMEGGLPRGQKSWSAIRVKREETHWQAPPGWERAGGDRLDDIFK